jgi:hypothetical protein
VAERKARARPRATTHTVQATVEAVEPAEIVGDGRKVELNGAAFRMSDHIGLMPLLKFANASAKGLDSNDMEGMVALYDMIRDCIDADEWPRFERHAIDTKAEADDLMAVVKTVIEALTARPSTPPGDSPAGRRSTSANSKGSSSPTGTRSLPPGLVSVDTMLDRSTG